MPDARAAPESPPAPWSTRLRAVVWWHPATPSGREAMPGPTPGATLPLTLSALVRYAGTPVGPYGEVLTSPALRLAPWRPPTGHVPFIAVDSEASVRGGRANWALPKVLSQVMWDGRHAAAAAGEAAHGTWRISGAARPRGPRLVVPVAARAWQPLAEGTETLDALVTGLALLRLARVDVTVEGPAAPPWLREGTWPGAVVERARVRVAAPRRRPSPTRR